MAPFNVKPGTPELNAAGLDSEASKRLIEREPNEYEIPILMSLREMYSCKPQATTFDIYSKDAIFHDPIGIAKGVDSVRNQFTALAKLFPRADIPNMRVLTNPPGVPPNTMLIDQDVAYYRNPKSSSPTKEVNSLLRLDLEPGTNKVLSHTEEWGHSKTSTGDDGVFGWMNEMRP